MTKVTNTEILPNFQNTEIAFQSKSDKQLIKTAMLFQVMNQKWLVDLGKEFTRFATAIHLPLYQHFLKKTFFEQFCGGVNLLDCQEVIDDLYRYNALTILDYGAESKTRESDIRQTVEQLYDAVEFAASNNSVPAVSSKLTALVDNAILEKWQQGGLIGSERAEYDKFCERISGVCARAGELGVSIFIDAEESWMQVTMDDLVTRLMQIHNRERATVYNTYQLYRKDKLEQLKADFARSQKEGYILGAKLVRGAYMEKERERASDMGYDQIIHKTQEDTDRDFDAALLFCLDQYEALAMCCASHNLRSNQLLAEEVIKRGIARDHAHINFCQLQGMSDYITYNLAQSGFNVAKYIVYGPVKEVISYLIRRAEENTAVSGGMSRELRVLRAELKRRKIKFPLIN